MTRYRKFVHSLLCITILTAPTLSQAMAGDAFKWIRKTPKSCLEQLAVEVDRLEHELYEDGTVVIKSPDIWGESRLIKHRQEFERIMEAKVNDFELLINASVRRSDQQYLANAFALTAALTPAEDANIADADFSFVTSISQGQMAGENPPVSDGGGTPATSFPINRTRIDTDGFKKAGFAHSGEIGLEPTIKLDQMKRYLDHLHEIRRVNEGDDTADSPGYSLNLVRIPVSILPGDKTRKGYGAEVTVSAEAHITPELLPRVFRELVINDLVDMLAPMLISTAEGIDRYAYELDDQGKATGILRENWRKMDDVFRRTTLIDAIGGFEGIANISNGPTLITPVQNIADPQEVFFDGNSSVLLKRSKLFSDNLNSEIHRETYGTTTNTSSPELTIQPPAPNGFQLQDDDPQNTRSVVGPDYRSDIEGGKKTFVDRVIGHSGLVPTTSSSTRNARIPFGPSQAIDILGKEHVVSVAYEFWKSSSDKPFERHLVDARSYLTEQLNASFDYLLHPNNLHNWSGIPDINTAVRTDSKQGLISQRKNVDSPYQWEMTKGNFVSIEVMPTAISSGAWWILVESALLNEQLKQDIKRVQHDPGCECLCNCDCGCVDFYPTGYMEAETYDMGDPREIFANYVRCRWPIHVFALDPVVDQQNVADQFSMRREMQLAIALAFASGNIRAQNMLRLARRLEIDMETIALNRTVVAFGHGSDTFGWRFTPRVQTPDFESNTTALLRTAFSGGPTRDQIKRQSEIEPGQRECVAVVLMPNFIEHINFEARGNYFELGECKFDPRQKNDLRSKVAQNVSWSEQMQTINQLLCDVECSEADRFLPNEVNRVRSRVKQLTRKMPLQSVHARVPNENTMGGFEMFSSGITDLAPELLSYYGVPGVDPHDDTLVYLVGNNFSVHDTHVLAGNRECPFSLISRQVMKVTIPAGVQVEKQLVVDSTCKRNVIDVHVATPYGVTAHVNIPVIEEATEQKLAWDSREIPLLMKYSLSVPAGDPKTSALTIEPHHIYSRGPNELLILVPPFATNAATEDFGVQVFLNASQASIPVKEFPETGVASAPLDSFRSVPLSMNRKGYLLNGTQYGYFIKAVRDGIQTLFAKLPEGQAPPELLDLEVVGQRGHDKIGGSLHIMIKLEKL